MSFSHRLEPLLPVLLTLEGIEKVLEELDGTEMLLFPTTFCAIVY
jgi:hypothetical protein